MERFLWTPAYLHNIHGRKFELTIPTITEKTDGIEKDKRSVQVPNYFFYIVFVSFTLRKPRIFDIETIDVYML